MARVELRFLNRAQVRGLLPPMAKVLDIVKQGLPRMDAAKLSCRRRDISISMTATMAISIS